MSFVIKDEFPIEEIKAFLVGKKFARQGVDIVYGEIDDVTVNFKILFDSQSKKTFFKPSFQIKSSKGVWYEFDEVWIESIEPYREFIGTALFDARSEP